VKSEKIKKIVAAGRLYEVIMMSGFFMVGWWWAINSNKIDWLKALTLWAGVIFYTLSVYNLNAYTDYEYDSHNPRLKKLGTIKKWQYGIGIIILFVACECIFYKLNVQLVWAGLAGFGLWCLYYLPGIKLKASMLGGTFIHLIGGMVHFHFGWMAVQTVSVMSILCSLQIALLLCAGHINHEMLDYESDKAHSVRTTTVRIGLKKAQWLHVVLFAASGAVWVLLYTMHYLNTINFLTLLIAYAGSGSWRLLALLQNKPVEPRHWRTIYRWWFIASATGLICEKIFI
jgi:4-hydroxybenzoate polyprenyltransferase